MENLTANILIIEGRGQLYIEITYKDGIRNGLYKKYYKSGIVEQEGNNLNDSRDGIWKIYDEGGKLIKEIEYKLGTETSRKEYR